MCATLFSGTRHGALNEGSLWPGLPSSPKHPVDEEDVGDSGAGVLSLVVLEAATLCALLVILCAAWWRPARVDIYF